MKLTKESIKHNVAWKGYRLPQYDIDAVRENTHKAPTWLHFGAGNLFRAFPAVLAQRLLTAGLSDTGIICCDGYDEELIDRCGFPRRLFGPLSQPGTRVGALLPEIAQAVGFDTQILLAPTHDTAAAVMAAPLEANDAYLSSGTWSLLGMELPAPILTPESRARNLTNEGGAQGTIRYLKNIMGLWMLQELRRWLRWPSGTTAIQAGWTATPRAFWPPSPWRRSCAAPWPRAAIPRLRMWAT